MSNKNEYAAAAFHSLEPMLAKLSAEIVSMPFDPRERLALAVLVATHFAGTAAALIAQIAREKGGPEMDEATWTREISNMIARQTEAARH